MDLFKKQTTNIYKLKREESQPNPTAQTSRISQKTSSVSSSSNLQNAKQKSVTSSLIKYKLKENKKQCQESQSKNRLNSIQQFNQNLFKSFKSNQNQIDPFYNPYPLIPNDQFYNYYKIKDHQRWLFKQVVPQTRDHRFFIKYHKQMAILQQIHLQSENQNKTQNQEVEGELTRYQFKHSQSLSSLEQNLITSWLKTMYQQTFSDTFNKYLKNDLDNKEFKVFASKNIILNIASYIQKLSEILMEQDNLLENKYHRNIKKEEQIITKVNKASQKIVEALKYKFPQSDSNEGSKQLNDLIKNTDKIINDQYDLLYNYRDQKNQLKINFSKTSHVSSSQKQHNKRKNSEKEFFSEIMKVLNYIMKISSQPFEVGNLSVSNFDAFKEMLIVLFQNPDEIKEKISKKVKNQKNVEQFKYLFKQLKKQNKQQIYYQVGTKIPEDVSLFSQQEIYNKMFKINDGSILRIMTKWAEQLREKLQKSLKINECYYGVKTRNGKIKPIHQISQHKNQIKRLSHLQQQKMIEQHKQLKQHFQKIQNQIINQSFEMKQFNSLDTNIGIISSQIQMILGNYLFQYINKLIKSLVHISYELDILFSESQKIKLDFVTFKIGDLMRGKCIGSMKQIKKIYETMYQISGNCPQVLQIIRVKNRLNKKDKDLLINIMFMKKFQCQIQLAVNSKVKTKDKAMNQFNHFLYQLQRASFGVISECCSIIAKNDPSSKLFKYPHQYQITKDSQKLINRQITQLNQKSRQFIPFMCFQCKKLKRNSNPNYYSIEDPICNQCFEKKIIQSNQEINQALKNFLLKVGLDEKEKIVQIKNAQQIPKEGILISKIKQYPACQNIYQLNYPKNSQSFYIFTYYGKLILEYKQNEQTKVLQQKMNKYYLIKKQSQNAKSKKDNFKKQKIFINVQKLKEHVKKETSILNLSQWEFLGQTFQEIKNKKVNLDCFQILNIIGSQQSVSSIKTALDVLINNQKNNITQMNLTKTQLYQFDEKQQNFINSEKLQKLELIQTEFYKLYLLKCPNLKILNCGNNKLLKQVDVSHFPNLEQLNCSHSNVSKIYSSKNNNNKLKKIECSSNYELTQINVCQFPALETLDCNGCSINKIYSQDQNNNLKILRCSFMFSLQIVDITLFPKLQQLYCFHCSQISKIICQNKNNCLKILECGLNKTLAQLDASQFPMLDQLHFQSTKLLKLNISQNFKLTQIHGIVPPSLSFMYSNQVISNLTTYPPWILPYRLAYQQKNVVKILFQIVSKQQSLNKLLKKKKVKIHAKYHVQVYNQACVHFSDQKVQIRIPQIFSPQQQKTKLEQILKNISSMVQNNSHISRYKDKICINYQNFQQNQSQKSLKYQQSQEKLKLIFKKLGKSDQMLQKKVQNMQQLKLQQSQKFAKITAVLNKQYDDQINRKFNFSQFVAKILIDQYYDQDISSKNQQQKLKCQIQSQLQDCINLSPNNQIKVQTYKKTTTLSKNGKYVQQGLYKLPDNQKKVPNGETCSLCQKKLLSQVFYLWSNKNEAQSTFICIQCMKTYDQKNNQNKTIVVKSNQEQRLLIPQRIKDFKKARLSCFSCDKRLQQGQKQELYVCTECRPYGERVINLCFDCIRQYFSGKGEKYEQIKNILDIQHHKIITKKQLSTVKKRNWIW